MALEIFVVTIWLTIITVICLGNYKTEPRQTIDTPKPEERKSNYCQCDKRFETKTGFCRNCAGIIPPERITRDWH